MTDPAFESTPGRDGTDRGGRGIGEMITEVTSHLSTLIRKEFDLLRAELSERMSDFTSSIVMLGIGAVLALVALHVLAVAALAALVAWGLEVGWAALILGGIIGLIAAVLIGSGMSGLKAKNLVPKRTARSLEKDATTIGRASR